MQSPFAACECPVPPHKLTQNQAHYETLYATGADVPGCRWNEVYSAANFRGFYPTQDLLIAQRDPALPVPVFSFEKPNAHRKYTLCSYAAMMRHLRDAPEKHYYAMHPPDVPLHFYCDFDLSADEIAPVHQGQRSVHGAMGEFFACFDAAVARLRQTEPSWANCSGDYTVSILYAHKTGKQSAHVVVHLAGLCMLASVAACLHLYAMVVTESLRRFPRTDDNPLFFRGLGGEHKCILDKSVYSPWRNFRTVGSFKNKMNRAQIAGGLFPACPAWTPTAPGSGCADADCFYHVHGRFRDVDFLANDSTFIPRLASGAPCVPQLLAVPEVANPLLKKNARAVRAAANQNSSILSAFPLFASSNSNSSATSSSGGAGARSAGSLVVTPVSRTASLASPAAAGDRTMRGHCFRLIAQIVGAVTGSACDTAGGGTDDADTVLVTSSGFDCPYAYRTKHPHADRDAVGQMHRHRHNHVCFLATIDLPLPRVSCRCSDSDCRDFLERHKRYVPLDVEAAPQSLLVAYAAAARAYMLDTQVPMFSLYN